MERPGKASSKNQNQIMGIVAIIVVAVFVVGVIVIFAKSLFSGIDSEVTNGVDTNTIAVTAAPIQTSADDTSVDDSIADDSSVDDTSSTTDATTSSSVTDTTGLGTKTVNAYAYLRKEPNADSEEIICMSPNIVVTVLTAADSNGYVEVTFLNTTGQLTGYVHQSYLS